MISRAIERVKRTLKSHWPAVRLRTILFGTLLLTAALPGVGALFLRVYENTLVRQTETELIAQGAALVATCQALWPGAVATRVPVALRPEASTIDLRSTPVFEERPKAVTRRLPPDAAAMRVAGRLAPIIAVTENTTLASIELLDRNGVVVLGRDAGRSYAQISEVAAGLQGKVATVLRTNGAYSQVYAFEWLSRASSLRIHHARPVIVNGRVVGVLLLARSPRALFRGLYEDRGKIILGIALIFMVLLVLTGLLSRGIARPIEALGRATRDVAAGTGSVPETPATAAIEIRELYENFRGMAATIDRRSHYLRDFAASVSHEFKTPLAGIAGAIELLEDHGTAMKPADRKRFLGNIKNDAGRLSQLVTRLLDLARADMAKPNANAAVDALAAILNVADAFDRAEFQVRIEVSGALPMVGTPQSTLEAVLNALLENAYQAGATVVSISAMLSPHALRVTVMDDGPGIQPRDAERVFEPFFTTRRAAGGTGLGLAISQSLLRAGGGELAIGSAALPGARFVLTLPFAEA